MNKMIALSREIFNNKTRILKFVHIHVSLEPKMPFQKNLPELLTKIELHYIYDQNELSKIGI